MFVRNIKISRIISLRCNSYVFRVDEINFKFDIDQCRGDKRILLLKYILFFIQQFSNLHGIYCFGNIVYMDKFARRTSLKEGKLSRQLSSPLSLPSCSCIRSNCPSSYKIFLRLCTTKKGEECFDIAKLVFVFCSTFYARNRPDCYFVHLLLNVEHSLR